MKRVKEVPPERLAYIKNTLNATADSEFAEPHHLCTFPVRAVKMRIQRPIPGDHRHEDFYDVIIPAVDVYARGKSVLKDGFLKRDSLSYFIAETHKPFPFGHVFASSGYLCLGTIFVPSAVPEHSVAMPLETLFLHNDRNLNHGGSHLYIGDDVKQGISAILTGNKIQCSSPANQIDSGCDLIKYDEIWNLSVDVLEQKPLPEALQTMSAIFDVLFAEDRKQETKRRMKEVQQETEITQQ